MVEKKTTGLDEGPGCSNSKAVKKKHPLLLRVASVLLIVGLLMILGGTASAAPGDLDPTFGTGGKLTTDFGGGSFDRALALTLQPDGKLVAAGLSNASGSFDFALARYNTASPLPPSPPSPGPSPPPSPGAPPPPGTGHHKHHHKLHNHKGHHKLHKASGGKGGGGGGCSGLCQ